MARPNQKLYICLLHGDVGNGQPNGGGIKILCGPYHSKSEAEMTLIRLRRDGLIPENAAVITHTRLGLLQARQKRERRRAG